MKSPQIFKKFPRSLSIPYHVGENPGDNSKLRTNAQCQKVKKIFLFVPVFGISGHSKNPNLRDFEIFEIPRPGMFLGFSGYFRGIKIPILNPGYRDFSDLDPRNSDISRSRFRLSGLRNLQPCPDLDMIFYYSQKTAPEAQQGA